MGHFALELALRPLTPNIDVNDGPGIFLGPVEIRSAEHLRPFLEDPDSEASGIVSVIYQHLCPQSDARLWQRAGLRYGMTVLRPGCLGREWVKTAGHYRSPASVEMMEIVLGSGIVLVQTPAPDGGLEQVTCVKLQSRSVVVIPPRSARVLVNTGTGNLAVGHVASGTVRAEHEELARHRGAAYYLGPDGARPNPHYLDLPPLRTTEVDRLPLIRLGRPLLGKWTTRTDLYGDLLKNPEKMLRWASGRFS